MSSSRELLNSLCFTVIDLETTGGGLDKDKIIEIGMVKIKKLEIVDSVNFLVDPEKKIPEFIQKLTSISQNDVKGRPKIESLLDKIISFIGDDILVAHNTSFDIPFLNSVLKRDGRAPLKNKVLCTNVMTKHMIPEIMASNLAYMGRLFNIEHHRAHRAQDDALASANLLLKYLSIFEEKGIRKVNQLYYPRNKFELDRVNYKFDEISDRQIIEKISIFQDPLTIGIKGERGVFLGLLPLSNPQKQISQVESFLRLSSWEMVTIKLNGTMLESLFEFNSHFNKYSEEHRMFALNFLEREYNNDTESLEAGQLEFLVTPHLVPEQIMLFNMRPLNPIGRHIYRLKTHKKKFYNTIERLKKAHVRKKQSKEINHFRHIVPEMQELVSKEIALGLKEKKYLHINSNEIKAGQSTINECLEHFNEAKRLSPFPLHHL